MKNKQSYDSYSRPSDSRLFQLYALLRWSLVRYKVLLPVFTVAQLLLSLAIVYGLTFLIPTMDDTTAVYLSSGAIVLGIIAVGCVLSAQIVSTAKQNGIVSYQRTLPVSRFNLLLADFYYLGIRFFTRNPDVFSCFLPKIWSSDSFFCPVCRFIDFNSNVDDFYRILYCLLATR